MSSHLAACVIESPLLIPYRLIQMSSKECDTVVPMPEGYESMKALNRQIIPEPKFIKSFTKLCMEGLNVLHMSWMAHGCLTLNNLFLKRAKVHTLKMACFGNTHQFFKQFGARIEDAERKKSLTVIANRVTCVVKGFTEYNANNMMDSPFPCRQIHDFFELGCCIYEIVTKEKASMHYKGF